MRRHIFSFIKGTALRRAGALKHSGLLARQLQVLPDQDFGTECFLEAWSAEEISGFVHQKKIIMQV
jgi:hypothetical protein